MAQTGSLGARAHAAGRARHAWLGAMAVMAMVVAACAPTATMDPDRARAAVAAPVQVAKVQRGTIQQVVAISGEVRAKGQIAVMPKATGRVQRIMVDAGSVVKAGDTLFELETETPTLQLQQAKANVAAAEARLAQVRAGGKADDVAAARLAVEQQELKLEQMRQGGRVEDGLAADAAVAAAEARLALLQSGGRAEAIAQAQASLDAAQARLELLQKGATPDVRQAAQSAVDADMATLASAQAALAAFASSSVADAQAVQSQVGSLQSQVAALQESLAATETVQANIGAANASDVQSAQSALDTATAQRDAARAALAQADKPTDVQLASAKQAVFQAQAAKDAAQATATALDQGVPPALNGTACSNNGVLRDETTCTAQKKAAELSVVAAQRAEVVANLALDLLNTGGAPATRAQLQAAVATGEAQVKAASYRLGQVQGGAYAVQRAQVESQRAQAQSSLTAATENLKAAQARLDAIKSGASGGTQEAQRQALLAQVAATEQKIKADQARVDQLAVGPQDEEIRAAQAAVRQATAALDLARQPVTDHDVAAQGALVEQARQLAAKARKPYTEFDLQQQELAVQAAQVALHARQVPYTAQDAQGAEAAVEQARAQVALAEANLRETTILSPIDGIILERLVSLGAMVGPGIPVANVATNVIEVAANVAEASFGQVVVGQTVTLQAAAFPGVTFEGKVSNLAPTVDTRTRMGSLRVVPTDPDGKLKPGMLVQVGVVTAAKDGALVLPRAAMGGPVATGGSGTVLAVDSGNRVHPVTITIGAVSEATFEVAGGLTEGQSVVTGGASGLGDGDAVEPAAAGAASTGGTGR